MQVEENSDGTEEGVKPEYFTAPEPSPNAVLVANTIRDAAVLIASAILATDVTAQQRIQGMMKLVRNLASPRPKE